MRWRINNFVFCERQQTLTSIHTKQKSKQQLEPMVVELLTFFCQNTNQIVSRTQLIDAVWMGRMITDNAVSKVVTKLRKSFNDDPKKPKYIATFPKKGYKFIADVTRIGEVSATVSESKLSINNKINSISATVSSSNKIQSAIYILLTLFILGISLMWYKTEVPQPITQVEAMTRDSGRESRGQISPNGKYLAYIEVRDKKMHQWIKSLNDETIIEVNHGDGKSVWVDSVSWNSDGNKIVYLVTTPKTCQYFIRSFDKMVLGEPRLIHNCPAGSYGKIAYTHDNNRLIYSESEGSDTPFSLFEFNLKTGVKRRLNQPELFLGGNSQFDLHPTKNMLLISSPDKQQWEGFYSLDLNNDKLILLFKQDAYICCGIWDHTGNRVVLMGEHPAFQLVSYDLEGNDRQVVYTGSEQLRSPERHRNGKDYIFSVVHNNQNVYYFDFNTNMSKVIANSSVDDRMASFSQHNNQVSYISLSSGNEEIWLTDIDGNSRQKLTQFKDSRHYIDQLWSYNGDYLLGVTLNEIHLINSKTSYTEVLKIPQVQISGVSWKSNRIISYSTRTKHGWRVYDYDIESQIASPKDIKWKFIRYAQEPEDVLSLDKNGALYLGNSHIKVVDSELLSVDFMKGRAFNLKKLKSIWAWQIYEGGKNKLFMKKKLNYPAIHISDTNSNHFDLSSNGLIYHQFDSLNADLYRTVVDR